MKNYFKRWLTTVLTVTMLTNCISYAYADTIVPRSGTGSSGAATATESDVRVDGEDEPDPADELAEEVILLDFATPSQARIGDIQVTSYGELQVALASASDGTRIEIMNDLSPDDGSIVLNHAVDAITGATLVTTAQDVMVEGNGFTIHGNGYPTFDSDGGDLTVENLIIDGAGYTAKLGGAVFVEYGGALTMRNVTIQNCFAGSTSAYGGGGAVYVNNHGSSAPTFTAVDCHFINNAAATGRGGAIYGSTGNVVLENCLFEGNSAVNGGAIAMDGRCELTMTGCQVQDNTADISGGGVYIYHGESAGRRGTVTSYVPAEIDSSNQVSQNTAGLYGDDIVYGRYYSASYSGDPSELTLNTPVYDEILYTDSSRTDIARIGSEIQVTTYGDLKNALAAASNGTRIEIMNDLSPTDGSVSLASTVDAVTGATLAVTGRQVAVEGNNHTITGHGYPSFDSDGGDLTVENLTIDGAGYTAKLGGAVFVEDGGMLTMRNVTIQNCFAGSTAAYGGGGAVYVNNHGGEVPVFTAVDCRFINNSTPNGNGGAIYGSKGNVNLEGCVFEQNSAANGGAVAMDNVCELTMTGCRLEDNRALVGGGAVYIYHGNSAGKRNSVITSRVTASVDAGNQFAGNTADLAGNDILYGRFYTDTYTGDKTETTLTAPEFDDVQFTSLERNQLPGNYYLEKTDGVWYLKCDTISDIQAVLAGIETVTVDGDAFTVSEVFDAAGAVRFGSPAVFEHGSSDCYTISVESNVASGTFVAGDLSLARWNHDAGWISFLTYIDSTNSGMVSLWKQAAAKFGQDTDAFKAMWRSMCDTGNGIETIKVTGNVITAYRHDKTVVFSNTYECAYKTMTGLEGGVTYGFKAQGAIADEQFRYVVLMVPGFDGEGSMAAHYHFRYGAEGFDELFGGVNDYWYPTMCDAGATLTEQYNVLIAMFGLTDQTSPGTSTRSGGGGGGSVSSGSWQSDQRGWWYRYNNGTWPADCWAQLAYNGTYAWYHFDADGYMQSGWFTDSDGLRYYLNPVSDGTKGRMMTGWNLIDGSWYCFNDGSAGKSGYLFTSTTTPDGYQVDQNGVWK